MCLKRLDPDSKPTSPTNISLLPEATPAAFIYERVIIMSIWLLAVIPASTYLFWHDMWKR
jgi:hypothetical protein